MKQEENSKWKNEWWKIIQVIQSLSLASGGLDTIFHGFHEISQSLVQFPCFFLVLRNNFGNLGVDQDD
eukprot:snap_masked-scaffold_20-processed-gene-3.15-mRNA-1 protein AED:1.00 eAED:1.00 QI:0/0/0/0/1/1/2/0/67